VIISILFSNKRGIVFKVIRNQKRKKEFREKLENKKAGLNNFKINNLERGK
jgi:ABC-3 protein